MGRARHSLVVWLFCALVFPGCTWKRERGELSSSSRLKEVSVFDASEQFAHAKRFVAGQAVGGCSRERLADVRAYS